MSSWLVVWFVVWLVTTVALLVFGLALGRQAWLLGRIARRMGEETGAIARDIGELGARASEKSPKLQRSVRTPGRAARG